MRIYGTKSLWVKNDAGKKKQLLQICQFACSVYVPGYLKVFYHPSATDGPQTMLDIRDYLISAYAKHRFPAHAQNQVKKIFLAHASTWLSSENVALAVFSNNNQLTHESLSRVSRIVTPAELTKMLWKKRCKLTSFFSAESSNAPCMTTSNAAGFWQAAMGSNRSCERI